MAGFDYDHTLVKPKGGKVFPKDLEDYEFLYDTVPDILRKLHEDGYFIVIFTNQSKKWKCEQIKEVAEKIKVPMFVVIATERADYKPNKKLFTENFSMELGPESFFVGDAIGRASDFSDSDKVFAENIGIRFSSPEDLFKTTIEFQVSEITPTEDKEIIVLVGYPGSGKTTIATSICKDSRYIKISGDEFKTSSKMISAAKAHVLKGERIVFDATNGTIKRRKEYIDFSKNIITPFVVYMLMKPWKFHTKEIVKEKPLSKCPE